MSSEEEGGCLGTLERCLALTAKSWAVRIATALVTAAALTVKMACHMKLDLRDCH
jgi:hypothetical protein